MGDEVLFNSIFTMVPNSKDELMACISIAVPAAAALMGIPAIMAVLKMGGLW